MKTIISISKQFKSYGHYKITAMFEDGSIFSQVTTNMPLIDQWYSDDEAESDEAQEAFKAMILNSIY